MSDASRTQGITISLSPGAHERLVELAEQEHATVGDAAGQLVESLLSNPPPSTEAITDFLRTIPGEIDRLRESHDQYLRGEGGFTPLDELL